MMDRVIKALTIIVLALTILAAPPILWKLYSSTSCSYNKPARLL